MGQGEAAQGVPVPWTCRGAGRLPWEQPQAGLWASAETPAAPRLAAPVLGKRATPGIEPFISHGTARGGGWGARPAERDGPRGRDLGCQVDRAGVRPPAPVLLVQAAFQTAAAALRLWVRVPGRLGPAREDREKSGRAWCSTGCALSRSSQTPPDLDPRCPHGGCPVRTPAEVCSGHRRHCRRPHRRGTKPEDPGSHFPLPPAGPEAGCLTGALLGAGGGLQAGPLCCGQPQGDEGAAGPAVRASPGLTVHRIVTLFPWAPLSTGGCDLLTGSPDSQSTSGSRGRGRGMAKVSARKKQSCG